MEIDYDKCIGCRMCMAACPYNARTFKLERSGARHRCLLRRCPRARARPRRDGKCTLCKERTDEGDEPMCVRCCPADARIFGDLDDPDSAVSRLRRDQGAEVLLEDRARARRSFTFARRVL